MRPDDLVILLAEFFQFCNQRQIFLAEEFNARANVAHGNIVIGQAEAAGNQFAIQRISQFCHMRENILVEAHVALFRLFVGGIERGGDRGAGAHFLNEVDEGRPIQHELFEGVRREFTGQQISSIGLIMLPCPVAASHILFGQRVKK